MKISISLLFVFLFGITACDNDIQNDPAPQEKQVFIFGSFAGECLGNCVHYYKIEAEKLYADDIDHGIPDSIPFQTTPLSAAKYQLAEPLSEDIPDELLTSNQQVYGCPDCYDQGGIYLELRNGDKVQKWQLDTDSTDQSSAILEYKQRVVEVLVALQ